MAVIVKDSFNRPNNTTTLGVAETGQPWVVDGIGTWGISNNTAYAIRSTWNYAVYLNAGVSDNLSFEIKYATAAEQAQLVWRYRDTNNNFTFQDGVLYKILNGDEFILGTTVIPIHGDVIKIELIGNKHTLYINGIKRIEAFSEDLMNETKFGFGTNYTAAARQIRFDDFLIQTLGDTPNNSVDSGDIPLSSNSSVSVTINKNIYGNLDISGNTNHTVSGSKLFNNSVAINSNSELSAISSKVSNNPINLNSDSDIGISAQKVVETESIHISNDSNLSFEGKKTINNEIGLTANVEMDVTPTKTVDSELFYISSNSDVTALLSAVNSESISLIAESNGGISSIVIKTIEPISLSGNTELSLQSNIARSGTASLSSSSMLDVESNSGVLTEPISLISESFISTNASRLLNASTSLGAESKFTVEPNNRIHMDDLVLSSNGSIECIPVKVTDVLIKLLSEGSFIANTVSTANGEVLFSATGDMYVESIRLSKDISVELTGSSSLSFAGSLINGVVIGLENESFVNIESNRLINNGLSFDSTTNLLVSGLKSLSDSVNFQSDNLLMVTGSIKVEGDIYLSNESELVLTLIDIYIKIIETDVTLKTRMISEMSIVKTVDSILKVVQTFDSELETIQTVDSTSKVVRSLDATSKL